MACRQLVKGREKAAATEIVTQALVQACPGHGDMRGWQWNSCSDALHESSLCRTRQRVQRVPDNNRVQVGKGEDGRDWLKMGEYASLPLSMILTPETAAAISEIGTTLMLAAFSTVF